MRPFAYYAPRSLKEAIALFREQGEGGRALAGGTDLLVQLQEDGLRGPYPSYPTHPGLRPYPRYIVSLRWAPELRGLSLEGDGLRLGATVTMAEIEASPIIRERFPILAQAAGLVGSVQLRHMATVGGNLGNAAPSGDLAPALLALDAGVHIAGPGGEGALPLEELFRGPGRTALGPGELLVELRVPGPPPRGAAWYERHTPRREMDIAVVGVGVRLALEDGRIKEARIALGAVAPTPLRVRGAEATLLGQPPSAALFQETAAAAAQEARPIGDVRGSAAFRRELVRVLVARCLERAAEGARP